MAAERLRENRRRQPGINKPAERLHRCASTVSGKMEQKQPVSITDFSQYVFHLGGRDCFTPDELDICEIQPDFADFLERNVLTGSRFEPGVAGGRVRLLRSAVQELTCDGRYDFVISGLPMTVFELHEVQDVFGVVRRSLKPGGVFSYFEYVGLRMGSRLLSVGRRRARIRSVSAYLSENIRKHQFDSQTVFQNLPPACARHLRFD